MPLIYEELLKIDEKESKNTIERFAKDMNEKFP